MNYFAPVTAPPVLACALQPLTASKVFMTFAWYGHLKQLQVRRWWTAAPVSWRTALTVSVPFAMLYIVTGRTGSISGVPDGAFSAP
jgi:hypothetical protein